MFTVLPTAPSRDVSQSLRVQLPTLRGISIPPLESEHHLSPPARISRPFVQRIDTKQRREVTRSAGHKHSRSLDIASGHPPPAKNPLDSAVSDSFILPWSNEHDDYAESPSSPLAGIYISQSSRNSSCSGNPGQQSVSDLPSSTPSSDLPSPNFDAEETGEPEEDADSESAWDLIPYDISWGPAYYGYREGTLPGPEGNCIFLRSPTPLKYQRTGQACEKCRERKAKCSGSRPSCARCSVRGLVCVYAPDSKGNKLEGGETCAGATNMQTNEPKHCDAPSTARIRRNTDCGSHAERVNVPNRCVTLRRRHSTIGSSRSASHASGELGLRNCREYRLAEGRKDGPTCGFLGALLDPPITCDDHSVSECNRQSYQSLTLPHTLSILNTLEIDGIACEEGLSCDLLQAQPQQEDDWTLARDESSCWNHLSNDDGSTHQSLLDDDKAVLAPSISTAITAGTFDVTNALLDQHISGVSRSGMPLDGYWHDDFVQIQTKVAAVGFSMDIDAPHIALPSHAPDFYEFDQNEAIRTWFPSSVY